MTLNVSNQTNLNTKKIEKLQKKQNKGGIAATALAIGGSNIANMLSSLPGSAFAKNSLIKHSSNLTSEQIQQIFESANNFIKSKGLDEKGVVINNCTNAGINLSGMPDKLYEMISPIFATAKGKNAFYTDKAIKSTLGDILYNKNSIVINMEKLPNAVFHEIGHAINNNTSKFWKVLQKMRTPGMLLASMLILFSAFTNKAETKDGKELTKAQKVKNAIRGNAGKLSFAVMVPML